MHTKRLRHPCRYTQPIPWVFLFEGVTPPMREKEGGLDDRNCICFIACIIDIFSSIVESEAALQSQPRQ